MSKPTSRRSRKHEWQRLKALIQGSDFPPESAVYVEALERSITKRDHSLLLALLEAGTPIHPALGPAFADAFRSTLQGSQGQNRAFTSEDDEVVRVAVQALTRDGRTTQTRAIEAVADRLAVSTDTIKRSLSRTRGARRPWPF